MLSPCAASRRGRGSPSTTNKGERGWGITIIARPLSASDGGGDPQRARGPDDQGESTRGEWNQEVEHAKGGVGVMIRAR